MNHRMTNLTLLVSIFLIFTGCAHMSVNPKSEKALRQKIRMEWEAKVKKNWGVVYDLTVDAYKNKLDRDFFVQRANINIKEFSIKEVKIIEPGRKALAVVDSKISQVGFDFHMPVKEEWLWENGDWHLNLLPTLDFPFSKKK